MRVLGILILLGSLAIAQENARLHGGHITVEDRPGGGAVFTLSLPRRGEP